VTDLRSPESGGLIVYGPYLIQKNSLWIVDGRWQFVDNRLDTVTALDIIAIHDKITPT
jgi:hypothetical protein